MQINTIDKTKLHDQLLRCCGSERWVQGMMAGLPFESKAVIMELAEKVWENCEQVDFIEASGHHPKIGDIKSLEKKFASTADWSSNEQQGVNEAARQTLEALAKGNADYEEKFGYIFIVCATGKSAAEMLAILQSRLPNTPEVELGIAMGEQHKITLLRLEKLLLES